ncbi:hypothetical protein K432DRAFT_427966 [Lepidopterella palustris CBS 459.81]|uniref:Peptidase S8/S53 domain-containing protein n=1 Tax=Lepidopterella palustris CBS 459.81 TaxID=1314670 RepID=A0A8E2E4Z8_9PEZI|nr:hypothetical protein K432DRAFT_427966 [Lepidopterella palustris CBS 459.81]
MVPDYQDSVYKELFDEIANGRSEKLQSFLENRPPDKWYTLRDECHGTLPAYALKCANLSAFDLMYQNYPTIAPNSQMRSMENLLWEAIGISKESRGVEVLRHVLEIPNFLEDYALKKMVDQNGRCAMHLAAQMGVTSVFRFIWKPCPNRENEEKNRAWKNFRPKVCNIQANDGQTPLHLAAYHDNLESLEILMRMRKDPPVPDNFGDTILHKALDRKSPNVKSVNAILTRYPRMILQCNNAHESPLQVLLKKKKDKNLFGELLLDDDSMRSEPFASLTNYDKTVEELLMEHALRECTTLEHVREILGKNYSDDLYFNASFLSNPATQFSPYMKARTALDVPVFPFLKYVRLPDLQCSAKRPCITTPYGGRIDPEALQVFNYLRGKGVTHIDEVTVPDCMLHPHSDQEIKDSLRGIRVRSIDWRKKDLSISSLQDDFRRVEELHLYSSGNKDVLDYWAKYALPELWMSLPAPLGSAKAPQLNITPPTNVGRLRALKINIFRARTIPYIIVPHLSGWENKFRRAIHANHGSKRAKPELCLKCSNSIKVSIDKAPIDSSQSTSEREDDENGSLNTREPRSIRTEMKPFLEFISTLLKPDESPEAQHAEKNPIKVAIIDSGVYCFPDMRYKWEGRSFIEDEVEQSADTHWHSPSNSHGTMLARLIFEMNPWCKFYVGKVKHGPHQGGVDIPTAIKALRWAGDQEVDVICLSWSITEEDAGSENFAGLSRAIADASSKALIFATTSDEGSAAKAPYPAKFEGRVLAITAADIENNKCKGADDKDTEFYLPSEGFEVDGIPEYLEASCKKPAQGSSYATALAAGVAALFLTCVQLTYHKGAQAHDDDAIHDMDNKITVYKNTEMKKLFKNLCGTGADDAKFVQPWKIFSREWNKKGPRAKRTALKHELEHIIRS